MEKPSNRGAGFLSILTPEEKIRFHNYYPQKVYRTEQTIAVIVAATQLFMILIVLFKSGGSIFTLLKSPYSYLYISLLAITVIMLPIYTKMIANQRYDSLIWLKRFYILTLCCWVTGITVLDQMHGVGLGVYCYLIPTMGAVLLISPMECAIIYSVQWGVLMAALWLAGVAPDVLFSSGINSLFATVLAVFISARHYRSIEVEFHDTETIKAQYVEIENANRALSKMAYTDQLTGLCNRRYLSEKFTAEFETYRAQGRYIEVLMLDIDFFKQYNDLYGHVQGDDCLKNIASVLSSCLANRNAVAIRYGGEEFLLLHFPAAAEHAGQLAEYVQTAIHQKHIPRSDTEKPYVTMSIGFCSCSLEGDDDLEKLICRADKALYIAKSSGRDCVIQG